MASSNVFEHSRPMLNRIGLRDLARLAVPHHRRRPTTGSSCRPAPASSSPAPTASSMASGVGRVRVAAAGRGEDLVAVARRRPAWPSRRAVALEVGRPARRRCSRARAAQMSIADTSPPSWPIVRAPSASLARVSSRCRCRCPPSRRAHAPGRRGARRPRAPTPGSAGRPGCRTCSPSRRGCSCRGRALPRGGTACTRPASWS